MAQKILERHMPSACLVVVFVACWANAVDLAGSVGNLPSGLAADSDASGTCDSHEFEDAMMLRSASLLQKHGEVALAGVVLQRQGGLSVQSRGNQPHKEENGEKESEKKGEKEGEKEGEGGKGEKEKEEEEKEEEEKEEAAARPVAIMLISAVLIIAIVFGMTHSTNRRVANTTFLAVDNVLAIFIAVMWFQAIHDMIEKLEEKDDKVMISIAHAITWLLVIIALAWFVRERPSLLAVVAGCGAHMAAFSATHAAFSAQKHFFADHLLLCFIGLVLHVALMVLFVVILHYLKKACFGHHDEWHEQVNDVETDCTAMATALAVTEFVRFVIVGRFPQQKGTDMHWRHTHLQRALLLGWSILIAIVGSIALSLLNKWAEHRMHTLSYGMQRVILFFNTFFPMCAAWGFLDWGQWHMYEELSFGPVFARILFADLATLIGLALIYILAMPSIKGNEAGKASKRFVWIRALSMAVGWSWEQAFDETFEESVHTWWIKMVIAIAVGIVTVPILIWYLKPMTIAIQEEEEGQKKPPPHPAAPALHAATMPTRPIGPHPALGHMVGYPVVNSHGTPGMGFPRLPPANTQHSLPDRSPLSTERSPASSPFGRNNNARGVDR